MSAEGATAPAAGMDAADADLDVADRLTAGLAATDAAPATLGGVAWLDTDLFSAGVLAAGLLAAGLLAVGLL
ncbi:hypothetical protein VK98_22630, partial [Chromobacterium sp. LK11]